VEPVAEPTYIVIARIARTRGNRGEVLADLYTDFPSRFNALREVWLVHADGRRERFALEEVWIHQGRPVLKFLGIDTISSAEQLAGAWVEIDSAQAVSLPEGMYFDHDLIDCTVYDARGESLGRVKEVLHIAGNDQLVVAGINGEFLLPAVGEICKEISIAEKRILADLPIGLMDLNK
jgi:16S rRNA processing protein RimM